LRNQKTGTTYQAKESIHRTESLSEKPVTPAQALLLEYSSTLKTGDPSDD